MGPFTEDYLPPNPVLAHGATLKTCFHPLLAQRDRAVFDQGLQEAEASDLPSFQTVARSFRQAYAAIIATLTTPWSTGPCEGQIVRVILIKRLGYGCAKVDVLRQRILPRRVVPMTLDVRGRRVHQQVAA